MPSPAKPRRLDYLPIDDLQGHPENPKDHDLGLLDESFDRFGFTEPVLLDERTGRLIAGHGRLERLRLRRDEGAAAPPGVVVRRDGTWTVPVIRGWSSADDDEARAYLVASNRITEAGGWHDDLLGPLLDDLRRASEDGLAGIGFSTDDVDALLFGANGSDPWSDRAKRDMPDARGLSMGEVWDVGPHRLVIGDSTDPACWAALPPAGLIVTDPPYGIGYTGGAGIEREVIDNDTDPEVAAAIIDQVCSLLVANAEPGAATYIFLPTGEAFPPLISVLHRHGLHRWSIVWVKDRATFGRADFHPQHEHISYAWTPGPRRVPVADRTLTTVWPVSRPSRSEHHPTEKPVALLRRAIDVSSHPGDVVMDPFAGSGSTLVAAAQAGRIGCGIELRPEYGRVVLDRLSAVEGVEPKRVD